MSAATAAAGAGQPVGDVTGGPAGGHEALICGTPNPARAEPRVGGAMCGLLRAGSPAVGGPRATSPEVSPVFAG